MKKIYLLSIITALVLTGLRVNGQVNVLKGSNMEDSTKWTVTQIDTVTGQTATVTFNYKDDIPSAGSGGAMRVTASNGLASTGNNAIVWQKVALKAGRRYVVDGAFKDIGTLLAQEFWCQWYINKPTPETAVDYEKEDSARAQINTWNTACIADPAGLDITIQTWSCENAKLSDTVVLTQDTIYTYGVKIGVWNAAIVTYDVVLDSLTLTDLDSTTISAVHSIDAINVNVYPNPASSVITLDGNTQFTQATILNMLGQEVMTVKNFGTTIDVSSLQTGVYFIKFRDNNNTLAVSKFKKK